MASSHSMYDDFPNDSIDHLNSTLSDSRNKSNNEKSDGYSMDDYLQNNNTIDLEAMLRFSEDPRFNDETDTNSMNNYLQTNETTDLNVTFQHTGDPSCDDDSTGYPINNYLQDNSSTDLDTTLTSSLNTRYDMEIILQNLKYSTELNLSAPQYIACLQSALLLIKSQHCPLLEVLNIIRTILRKFNTNFLLVNEEALGISSEIKKIVFDAKELMTIGSNSQKVSVIIDEFERIDSFINNTYEPFQLVHLQ